MIDVSSDVSTGYDLATLGGDSSVKAAEGIGPLPTSPSIFDEDIELEEVKRLARKLAYLARSRKARLRRRK